MADIARRYNLVAHAVADILEFIAFDEMAADLRTAIAAGEIKMTNEINPHMNTTDNNK